MRIDSTAPMPFPHDADVKIVWKGRRIARLVFPSGKIVEFDEVVGFGKPRFIDKTPDPSEDGRSERKEQPTNPSSNHSRGR